MSSFLINVLIPVMAALSTGRFRMRDAWIWSWATLAADLDYIGWILYVNGTGPNLHRALLHNAWGVVGVILLSFWAWRRWSARTGGTLPEFVDARPGWILVPFYHASAVFLDVLAGGVTLFWPLAQTTVFWSFRIAVDTTRPVPQPQVQSETGSYEGVPDVSAEYTWMTGEEFGILLVYLASVALAIVLEVRSRRAVRRARPVQVPASVPVVAAGESRSQGGGPGTVEEPSTAREGGAPTNTP